jgi:hypothetical protein
MLRDSGMSLYLLEMTAVLSIGKYNGSRMISLHQRLARWMKMNKWIPQLSKASSSKE